jgi:integrase
MATVKIKYLLRKDGLLYYQRGIPLDLRPHYSGRNLIRINLQTLDLGKAARLCTQYAEADDILWQTIRHGKGVLTTAETRAAGQSLFTAWRGKPKSIDFHSPIDREALRLLRGKPQPILLSDTLERYLSEHKKGQDPRFIRDVRRAIGTVVSTIGDFPLPDYSRDNARAVRDLLLVGHATATVRRRLGSIIAVFNLGRREFDIGCSNPFEQLQIVREGLDAVKRLPFSNEELAKISAACLTTNDDIRWMVSLLLATGARLKEIVGLRREDVFLSHEIPHIAIRPHEALGRTLKTDGSERVIPLLGIALWGGRQAMAVPDINGWIFPRYSADGSIRAGAASTAINSWIAGKLGIAKTIYSARHSTKDMLRDSGIPEEMAKALLGHGTQSISDRYGAGFTLQRKSEALSKALQSAEPAVSG